MLLVQFTSEKDTRRVGLVEKDGILLRILDNAERVYDLALEAGRQRTKLESIVNNLLSDQTVDYEKVITTGRLLPPLDHPDPAHFHVTGTGLTHLGSAKARDQMHTEGEEKPTDEPPTDSMRMFQIGLKGGKPPKGQISAQPEWFYKGNGLCVVSPGQALPMPSFALDGGEEAELVGLYVIAKSGDILRVGFALGNEFSDHVMERQNYLYLAHSKLRPCSFGPEVWIGDLPSDIRGRVRILRDNREIWSEAFLTGNDNMSYHIANLEHHHFKYNIFRQPGDVHCHFFGTATLSFSAGVETRPGDVFEIFAPPFVRPLRNVLQHSEESNKLVTTQPL